MTVTKMKVLLVDDNRDLLALLDKKLGILGLEVISAHSAADALKVLEATRVDAVLSDVQMPVQSGFELLLELRDKAIHAPIFLFTGDMTFDRDLAVANGAAEVFRKPLQADFIAGEISRAIANRRSA